MSSDAGTVIYASTDSCCSSRRSRKCQTMPKYNFEAKGAELRKHFRMLELEACQKELLPWVPVMKNIHALYANLHIDLPRDHPARMVLEALQQRLFRPLQTILRKDPASVTAQDIVTMKHLAKNVPAHLNNFQKCMEGVRHTVDTSEELYLNMRTDFMNFQGAFGKQKRSPAVAA